MIERKPVMNPRITVLPLQVLTTNADYFPTRHVVVAIVDDLGLHIEQRIKPNPNRLGLAVLRFHVASDPTAGQIRFTHDMAKTVINLVDLAKGAGLEEIIVSCAGAWSRSPAIAAALAKGMFGQDDRGFFDKHYPSPLIYRVMLEEIAKFNDREFPEKHQGASFSASYEPTDEGEYDEPSL
jgi:hypothetical protein